MKLAALLLVLSSCALAQLNQNCTISVLNRNVQANADGTWVLPNVPANFGQVKARATCVQNGVTVSGESAFFTITPNTAANLPPITLGSSSLIPVSLAIGPATPSLTAAGQTVQLAVTALYPDNSTQNVTAASTGTNYTISNPAIATISSGGLITAVSSGTVVIQANNDGAAGILTVMVTLSGSSHGGIPDSWLISYGLNPNDPAIAMEDPDRDGLTNLQEYRKGTDPNNPDTDGDGLSDGDEVYKYGTDPTLADSDGDGIPDGVEIATGTDPLNKSSYDLKKATATSSLTPASFTLSTSVTNPTPSAQLNWKVTLIDGKTTLDLTADPRTSYSSSNLSVCSFGSQKGLVFGANSGTCTITATQNTLSATASGTVSGFSPVEVSTLGIAGAVAVDVAGSLAYVATGTNGLTVVDVTDRTAPRIRGTVSGIGNIQAVRAIGQTAYVADTNGFFRIIQASNPDALVVTSSIAVAGTPNALGVHGNLAAVAAGARGVSLIDVSVPSSPALDSVIATPGSAVGVDFDPPSGLMAIAMGTSGLQLANISVPASPKLLGLLPGGDVRRVLLRLPAALLADVQRSVTSVNVSTPSAPVISTSLTSTLGGVPVDIAAYGNTAMTGDVTFGRAVPIIDIASPLNPSTVAFWTLQSPGYSYSVAVDISWGYIIIPATGTLRILKYQNISDPYGIPPVISITSPSSGATLIQNQTITFSANATDDVAVASVTFLVNGQPVYTSQSYPYQFTYTVPASATALIFSATAIDFGNNVGAAANVSVSVIPDPLTTVKGRVIDGSGNPVPGVTVSALGHMGTTVSDGTFTLSGLPTIQGQITVIAHTTISGNALGGISGSFAPLLGGVINTGDIKLAPVPLITSILPKSVLAGTTTTLTVAGANLTASTFAFGSAALALSAVSINGNGTNATMTLTVDTSVNGRFTLIGTNPAGPSDPTQTLGFYPINAAFNTLTIPGSDAKADPDEDGFTNAQEIARGTDPLNADTDGDGWPDGLEVALGSDPLNANSVPNPKNNWVSTFLLSILNNENPSTTTTGSKQYISSPTFSLLNLLNPSQLTTSSNQYVSSFAYSLLNLVNPATTTTGSKQYVSGLTFSILNAQNPSSTASKQYISSFAYSILNLLNPSIINTGSKQYVFSSTFSLLNGVSPAPVMPSVRFVNGSIFSIANGTSSQMSSALTALIARSALALRIGQPWLFPEASLGLLDSDGDGIPDVDELRIGTNPFDPDTDHDGYPDGLEVALGSDPLDPKSIPDLNRPGFFVGFDVVIHNYLLQALKNIPPQPAESRRPR